MKIRNNRGFAISTLLYGLSIMGFLIVILLMSIMSSNRVNTSNFVKQIEDDLNRYSLTEANLMPTNESSGQQEYIVPYGQEGWYKIELWGASGGDKNGYKGGKGAYTSGVIYLEENTHLYFYIGTSGTTSSAGKNGGGNSNSTTAGGGGATDVRLESGNYTDDRSMQTRIMVAAGGGGASTSKDGGKGGDLQGYNNAGGAGSATQISGNFNTTAIGSGGGFRNGGSSEGGSSYISGYAGSSSYALNTSTNVLSQEKGRVSISFGLPIYDTETGEFTGEYHVPEKGYRFVNGQMIAGVNSGAGKANIQKITTVSDTLPKKLELNNVKKIVDCVDGSTNSWKEIQAISNGENLVKSIGTISANPTITDAGKTKDGDLATEGKITATATQKCLTVTFSTNVNLDEIAVWHKTGDLARHSLSYCSSTSDSSCISLSEFNAIDNDSIKEGTNGLHYSAYRNSTSLIPPDGVYYIIPVNNEMVTFTTGDSTIGQDMSISLSGINGTRYQKWSLENVGSNYFKIVETQNYNVLRTNGSGAGVTLKAGPNYTGASNEKWLITPSKNGQYIITAASGVKITYNGSGITTALGSQTGLSTKFYLVNADY